MVAVVMFEFSVMRCQPLRRALCVFLASAMINQNFFLAMRHGWIKKQCPRASIWRLIFAILSGCKLLFLRCLFCLRTGW